MRPALIWSALLMVLLSLDMTGVSESRAGERWRKVRIDVPDKASLHRLVQMGVDFEGGRGKVGGPVECVVSDGALANLRSAGIAPEVLIDDLAAYYASRLDPGPANALGFGYGSMGGYYTLSEILKQLDTLRLLYPGVVGKRDSIGVSLQGRTIWAVRMTSNPDIPSGRPQVLCYAMHHAREPIGMMTLLYTMWYLAGHYGQDPEATYLLENRELWFVPILNVDGYEANRRIASGGGGMRRKNMRNVVNDADANGVDLNRNWDAGWGTGDSSPDRLNEVYCGSAPFSEPETQALRDFSLANAFRFVMEYHAYGLQIYSPDPGLVGSDTLLFQKYLLELTRYNHYIPWGETGLSGMAREWMYDYKPGGGSTFPFLIEVGNDFDGFWPATSRIFPLASENLPGNLFAAWAGGAFPKLSAHTMLDSSGDGDLEPGERFHVRLRLHNFGPDPATGFTVSATSGTPLLEVSGNPVVVGYLGAHSDTTILCEGRVLPTAPGWARGSVIVSVSPGNQVQLRDTVECIIGKSTMLFADGAEGGTSNWNMVGWGRSAASHSGQWSFTDSPAGLYPNKSHSTMTVSTPITIPPGIESARLRFWTKWRIETWYDYGRILMSTNEGSSWSVIPGEHTGKYMADGYSGAGPEWCEEDIDITHLSGRNVLLRLSFDSDEIVQYDGWYVDDISLRSYAVPGISYAHGVKVVRKGIDTIRITARVENPLAHSLKVVVQLNNDQGAFLDSLFMADDGLHDDSTSGDGLWGCTYVPKQNNVLHVTLRTDDVTAGTSRTLADIVQFFFTRNAVIAMDTRATDLGPIDRTLSRFDATTLVRNIGYIEDSLLVSLDPGSVVPDTAVSVFPKVLAIAAGDSQSVTFRIRPNLLPPSYYVAQLIVESKTAFGQTKFQKNYLFQVAVVGSAADAAGVPTEFGLGQNYPNPFNPSTTIRYAIAGTGREAPGTSRVKLNVYDVLGREVAVLVDERRTPGVYEVRFDGSGLSSGVYFYRMQTGEFVATKRFLLVR